MSSTGRKIANENDRRVRRTKKALTNALLKLLETKSFNEISVIEITELADINRATFYSYYDDVIDMILSLQEDVYRQFEALIAKSEPLKGLDDLKSFILTVLGFCKENAEMCKFLLTSDTAALHYKKILDIISKNAPNTLKLFPATSANRYITAYAVYASIGAISAWVSDGMKIPENKLADMLVNILSDGAKGIE